MMPGHDKQPLHPTQFLLPVEGSCWLMRMKKILKYFTTLLGRMGYSVRAFVNYREAEECLKHEHFDSVIVSQGSPGL